MAELTADCTFPVLGIFCVIYQGRFLASSKYKMIYLFHYSAGTITVLSYSSTTRHSFHKVTIALEFLTWLALTVKSKHMTNSFRNSLCHKQSTKHCTSPKDLKQNSRGRQQQCQQKDYIWNKAVLLSNWHFNCSISTLSSKCGRPHFKNWSPSFCWGGDAGVNRIFLAKIETYRVTKVKICLIKYEDYRKTFCFLMLALPSPFA